MLALLALLSIEAHARCTVERSALPDGTRLTIRADEEPVQCRTVSVWSNAEADIRARRTDATGRTRRIPARTFTRVGGYTEITAAGLGVGERWSVEVHTAGTELTLQVAEAPRAVPARHADVTRSLLLDARHPAWGFADPSLSRTDVRATYAFDPAVEPLPRFLALPEGTEVLEAGGLVPAGPSGLVVPPEGGTFTVHYVSPGAAPQGWERLPPGSLTIHAPGVALATTAGAGVRVSIAPGSVRFDAPDGGEARWRALEVGGVDVIPDVDTFVRGLEWRFARVSLPEPAVPVSLHGIADRETLYDGVLALARALRADAPPDHDPLRPRPLMRVVSSGWATSVERALVLHRLLLQERFAARWVLTGPHADPTTLTRYERMLVTVEVEGETRWIDPSCAVCAPGEVSVELLGRAAIGGAPQVPSAPGHLARQLRIVGERFEATFDASGAAALWLRQTAASVERDRLDATLAEHLGMPGAAITAVDGLHTPGAPVRVSLSGPRPPRDPFSPGEPPWSGGWADVAPTDVASMDVAPMDPPPTSD